MGIVQSLRSNAVIVLGNPVLALLAIAERREEDQRKVNPDLRGALFAPDRDELLDWLRTQPLAHVDRDLGWKMIHAGRAPKWTTQMAEQHAREVESRLRNGSYRKLFRQMYGARTAWSPGRNGPRSEPPNINLFTHQGSDRNS